MKLLLFLFHCVAVLCSGDWTMCPGSVHVKGHGNIVLTNAGQNTDKAGDKAANCEVHSDGTVVPKMNSRTYFSDECTGAYNNTRYSAMKLLGNSFRYTLDISGAGCGCNAAVYLTSLHQNPKVSECTDYYCDANSVCGVACAEIDIQEANVHAWHSTLHAWDDGMGMASVGGYGGNQARDWTQKEYGPGGECIDTNKPFQVESAFPINEQGVLSAMEITLTQEGKNCPLFISIWGYKVKDRNGMVDMTYALKDGMTPIISYWKSDKMLWLDGLGDDFKGPCAKDNAKACSESIKFYDFEVEPICTNRCEVGWCDKDVNGRCKWFTEAGAESYHCVIPSCDDAPEESSTASNCWSWKGVHYYSLKNKDAECQDAWHIRQRQAELIIPQAPQKQKNTVSSSSSDTGLSVSTVLVVGSLVVVAGVIFSMVAMKASRKPAQAMGEASLTMGKGAQMTPQTRMEDLPDKPPRATGTLRMVSSRELLLIDPEDHM